MKIDYLASQQPIQQPINQQLQLARQQHQAAAQDDDDYEDYDDDDEDDDDDDDDDIDVAVRRRVRGMVFLNEDGLPGMVYEETRGIVIGNDDEAVVAEERELYVIGPDALLDLQSQQHSLQRPAACRLPAIAPATTRSAASTSGVQNRAFVSDQQVASQQQQQQQPAQIFVIQQPAAAPDVKENNPLDFFRRCSCCCCCFWTAMTVVFLPCLPCICCCIFCERGNKS